MSGTNTGNDSEDLKKFLETKLTEYQEQMNLTQKKFEELGSKYFTKFDEIKESVTLPTILEPPKELNNNGESENIKQLEEGFAQERKKFYKTIDELTKMLRDQNDMDPTTTISLTNTITELEKENVKLKEENAKKDIAIEEDKKTNTQKDDAINIQKDEINRLNNLNGSFTKENETLSTENDFLHKEIEKKNNLIEQQLFDINKSQLRVSEAIKETEAKLLSQLEIKIEKTIEEAEEIAGLRALSTKYEFEKETNQRLRTVNDLYSKTFSHLIETLRKKN